MFWSNCSSRKFERLRKANISEMLGGKPNESKNW